MNGCVALVELPHKRGPSRRKKVLASEHDNLILIPEAHVMEREKGLVQVHGTLELIHIHTKNSKM